MMLTLRDVTELRPTEAMGEQQDNLRWSIESLQWVVPTLKAS